MVKQNIHIGSSFDDVLNEDVVLEESSARAIERVIAWQLQEAMKTQSITKTTITLHLLKLFQEKESELSPEAIEKAWIDESARRLEAYHRDDMEAYPVDDVIKELEASAN